MLKTSAETIVMEILLNNELRGNPQQKVSGRTAFALCAPLTLPSELRRIGSFVPIREPEEMQYPDYAGLDSEFSKIQFRCDVSITEALANQTINWAQRSRLLPKDTHEVNLLIRFFKRSRSTNAAAAQTERRLVHSPHA